jgi:hypothetical protein
MFVRIPSVIRDWNRMTPARGGKARGKLLRLEVLMFAILVPGTFAVCTPLRLIPKLNTKGWLPSLAFRGAECLLAMIGVLLYS